MMTSPNETFSALLALCGEFTGHRWIPLRKAVMWSFDVSFDLWLNERLSKQSGSRWFEMPSSLLWRHCNILRKYCIRDRRYISIKIYIYIYIYVIVIFSALISYFIVQTRLVPQVRFQIAWWIPTKHVEGRFGVVKAPPSKMVQTHGWIGLRLKLGYWLSSDGVSSSR